MPKFKYKAKKGIKEIVEGVITADNETEAVNKLAEQNLYPMEVNAEYEYLALGKGKNIFDKIPALKKLFSKKGISSKEMLLFTQKLATLTRAKMELLPSLKILSGQLTNSYFKDTISKICNLVKEGKSFSQSLRQFPEIFPTLFISIIRAGEASGNMEAALTQLTFFMQKKENLKNKVVGALIYPAILLCIGVASIFVILNFVIPKLRGLFVEIKGTLPVTTKIILNVSQFSNRNWMWVLVFLVGLIMAGMFLKGSRLFTGVFKWIIVRLPVIKSLIKSQDLASFSQALTLLLGSGVPALQALEIAGLSVENARIRKEIQEVTAKVRNGQTISSGMTGLKSLPDFFVKMIVIGEESGRLEEVLKEVADSYQQQIDTDITIITSILEPVLILALGVVLGGIVLSILLPIFQLTQMIH